MSILVALDPGKSKCGLILANSETRLVLEGHVVLTHKVSSLINSWQKAIYIDEIIIGNGSTCQYWHSALSQFAPIKIVDEYGSTLLARNRYWDLWPPSKFISWLPRGILLPPNNLDAVAALIILESYLGEKLEWKGIPEFKI